MAIYFNENTKTFYLEGKDISYVMCIGEEGFLQNLYFGAKIGRDDLMYNVRINDRGHETMLPSSERKIHSYNQYQNECPTYGRTDFRESMLAFLDERGSRLSILSYKSHTVYKQKPTLAGLPSVRGGETLAITLEDKINGSEVTLFYTVFEDLPVVLRHAEITNVGEQTLQLDRAYSFCLDLPKGDREVTYLAGAHLRERHLEKLPIKSGIITVDSKLGESSAMFNPFIAVTDKGTNEDSGSVYAFNLVYSGSYAFKLQTDTFGLLRILGGVNDYDFAWELAKGQTFITPEVVMVYSNSGFAKMSHAFHDLYRNYLIDEKYAFAPRPIVINNWEATYFNFNEEKLCAIIDSVKGTGIDTFVLDDGWFGNRNDDWRGLGDWFVNTSKLPNGLKPVIDHAHKNGLKFGIWFEPEMVNKDTVLYRNHPDWLIQVPGIEPCPGRHQYFLDFTRKEVRDYIIDSVSSILKTHEIDYVKWDMNRIMTDNYSVFLGKRSKEIHYRYMLGLYEVLETIIKGFPNVFFEGCASGGCRFDPGMLYYFPQIWTSDDSDAYERTYIQYGTSFAYPLSSHSCHVSVCPNHQAGRTTPFASRADIAHLGATGYELDTCKLNNEELDAVKKQVEDYKRMQTLVFEGDLYRLNNPNDSNIFAEQLVSKDKSYSVVTLMNGLYTPNGPIERVYPKGLDENKRYFIEEINRSLQGSTIMQVGLLVHTQPADFVTRVWHITEEK